MKTKTQKLFAGGLLLGLGVVLCASVLGRPPRVYAAAQTYTVNSTADGQDDDTSDGVCETASAGQCTLRAAIEQANANSGADTISFNITGSADFINGGQNGYTITPRSGLPIITETITINGYSQPGSQVNNNASPQALNGRLLIQIDGTDAGNASGLDVQGDSSVIRGLVINNFSQQMGIAVGADNTVYQGNYVGTDPTGMLARSNRLGFAQAVDNSTDAHIGGIDAADRNLISGNLSSGITPNTGSNRWVIQGNYVGVNVTGMASLQNNISSTSGSMSLDNSDDHLVGGPEPTAKNVISGNGGKGLAPNNTNGTTIENNYIGVAADGVTALGNEQDGIAYSGINHDFTIKNNLIEHNGYLGVYVDDATGVTIQGNKIMHNQLSGILMSNTSDAQIGGSSAEERNVISNNNLMGIATMQNITVIGLGDPTSNIKIQGNYLGVNESGQVDPSFASHGSAVSIELDVSNILIGGANAGEGNLIASLDGPGVMVHEGSAPGLGPDVSTPQNVSILGNSISGSKPASVEGLDSSGLGIDLFHVVFDNSSNPQSTVSLGPTLNDVGDSDNGPNNYINFPVINSANQSGNKLTVNFSLDAAGGQDGNYRVEFFASDSADASGYGEGQTYLGSTNVTNGNNKAVVKLASNTNLAGKVITATTTATNSGTSWGYGETSEFSLAKTITGGSNELANTGQNLSAIVLLAGALVVSGGLLAKRCIY